MIDLYDQIRPADESLDAATAARVWARIAGEQHSTDVQHRETWHGDGPLDLGWSSAPTSSRRARIVLGAAAGFVALVGVGGLLVVRGDNTDPTGTAASATVAASSAPVGSPGTVPTVGEDEDQVSPSTGSPADPVGFYLPTFLPDGYEISSLSAQPTGDPFDAIWFVRLDPTDQSVQARFSVRFLEAATVGSEFTPDATVRGVPAEVRHVAAQSASSPEQAGVLWIEDGVMMSSSSTGMSEADTIAATEALEIEMDARSVTLADNTTVDLQAVDDLNVVPDGAVPTQVSVSRFDGQPSQFLGASIEPNRLGQPIEAIIDEMAQQGDAPAWELLTVDGRSFYVQQKPVDQYGPFTSVMWVDGPYRLSVTGRVDPDDVVAFAVGLQPADDAAFITAGEAITTRAQQLSVIDEVTFADGVAVSVRALRPGTDGSGASALCIDAPIQRCKISTSESSLIGEFQSSIFGAFDLADRTVMIGWQTTTEAERTGQPTLAPNGTSRPDDARTTASITEQTATATGRFIEVDVPTGELPPQINYLIDGNVQLGVSDSPPTALSF